MTALTVSMLAPVPAQNQARRRKGRTGGDGDVPADEHGPLRAPDCQPGSAGDAPVRRVVLLKTEVSAPECVSVYVFYIKFVVKGECPR